MKKAADAVLRGNYSKADASFAVAQDCTAYSAEQHGLWRRLYARQAQLLPGRACPEFIDGLRTLDAADAIPNFDEVSKKLLAATGWRLLAVPGLIPDDIFFQHLAQRCFPVTVWLRQAHEFDYIVEPDIFHDFFGHVPLLFNAIFADHLQAYGKGGLKALPLGGLPYLARLYWYTIEFGLIHTADGVRAYGAGLLSSGGELDYCIRSAAPHRLGFDVVRIMRTEYKIDAYQQTYFVLHDFAQLFADAAPDFTPYYPQLMQLPTLAADHLLLGEQAL